MIKKIVVMILLVTMNSSFAQRLDDLNDINFQDSDLTVMLDDQVISLCYHIRDLQKRAGIDCSDECLDALLDQQTTEIEYETVLQGLDCCLNTSWKPQTEEECALRDSLEQMYHELHEEYNQLAKQLATRRIKCKRYTKVTTRELSACNANIHNNFTSNNVFVGNCLKVNGFGPNQAIITDNNGCLTAIDQLSNTLLAPNSVTGGPGGTIANNTITPSNLTFNTIQTPAAEPNPLRLVRGSVNGTTGAIISGAGFVPTRTGAGTYTIQFLTPYTNATSYIVLSEPTNGYGNLGSQVFISISGQAANLFNISTFNNLGAASDQDFVFFTLGA
jgi:hypothetical protein